MMTLRGLKRAVRKLAKGEYHSVSEKIVEYSSGKAEKEYTAYIHELDHTRSWGTPEGALDELKIVIKEKG